MKIEIHSINSLEKASLKPFSSNTVLISIGDTESEAPFLLNKPHDMLRLEFDDVTLALVREEFDLPKELMENKVKLMEFLSERSTNLFSRKQADKIADFVFKYKDSCEILICQCHYGQSRSAGCAAAIAEFLFKNGIEIFADDKYYPNKLVYHEVMKALERKANAK